MSKLVLIASVALYFAERGAAAERAVDQVTASIKTKAAEVFARARAARPEKADDRRDVSDSDAARGGPAPALLVAVLAVAAATF